MELWGPFLTVSGTRKGGAMGMRDPHAKRSALSGGKGVILRREMDYGFFSASWRLPVSSCDFPLCKLCTGCSSSSLIHAIDDRALL